MLDLYRFADSFGLPLIILFSGDLIPSSDASPTFFCSRSGLSLSFFLELVSPVILLHATVADKRYLASTFALFDKYFRGVLDRTDHEVGQ